MASWTSGANGRVAGKVAIVSGAARGLGISHATLLAQHGASVVLGDVDDDAGQQAADSLVAQGLAATFTHLDVTSASDWSLAVDLAMERYDKLDVLVNNAGILRSDGIEDETEEGWATVVAVNQTGPMLGIKACAPAMRRTGGGSIINIASISGVVGQPGLVAYQASKGAVRQLTKATAMQFAKERIRVNAVCPGVIQTEMLDLASTEQLERRMSETPMGRFGTPLEVSYCVLFLASDESSFVTGIDLLVDGGLVAH